MGLASHHVRWALFACCWLGLALITGQVHARDFNTIQQQGTLKVLYWTGFESYLPRAGFPLEQEKAAVSRFAEAHKLQVEFIAIENFDGLIPALAADQGDLIATNLTVTRERSLAADFTHPLAYTMEFLVARKGSAPAQVAQLNQYELAVPKGTSFVNTAQGLQKAYPGMTLRYLPSDLSTDQVLDKLVAGEIQLTILDGNTLSAVQKYRNDVTRSFQASGRRSIAWAVSKGNQSLLKQLNGFLVSENLAANSKPKIKPKNRWQKIKQEKVIRFVMRNNMASYFIWRGELHGFNYEMARHFAKQHNVRYQIIVAPDHKSMLDYLVDDKADIALGFLTPTAQRKAMGIAFSRPYHYASELVVARADEPGIDQVTALKGREIYVRPSSSYWSTVSALQKQVPGIKLMAVAETLETEELIDGVAENRYDLTIADSHILDLELTWRDDVQSIMALGDPKEQAWAVNARHGELLKVVNAYIGKQYRGLHYNVTYKKYFKNEHRLLKVRKDYEALKQDGRLSPYDDLVKEHAQKYNFDWRLLVSQMYQESRFDPQAESWAGAQGLFQVMPKTARELGVENLEVPENGIRAGVAYLDWVRDRAKYMNPKNDEELMWFALASYNAGAGHVRDAVRLAKQKGWHSDVWFDNVEQAMLLLSKREYARKARYGYVRGEEPVKYLRNIRKRYRAYQEVTDR
ncbi:MAG: lytic transglycosylase F [Pseudomonadales bacterium]|nr:lytic transglycosylase F [Pseudomonadales bacterium]MBI25324.1 lytic transglycosylase F [Pseudomonadales bacterium]HAG93556.1 lytic transglycosylase F [Gammaproteobacteria bacterium]HAU12342.1 lytic transglycosylase F [Gammaproteobacteria bacterium]HBO96335.1 lytic transglycosylase F [Gammaproteobacteria bacterium]|tara:strand:+ start:257 stop:2323 length:2067 start_codon:yes stop_codon:yes gene_type:complete